MVRHWHRNDRVKRSESVRQMLREGEAKKETSVWFLELESGWDCQATTMVYSLYLEEHRVLRTLTDEFLWILEFLRFLSLCQ